MLRKFLPLSLVLFVGCTSGSEPPRTSIIRSLEEMQGTWRVVTVTDPQGNGFEADNVEIVIKGDQATSEGQNLRLAFNADGSYLLIYAKVPTDPQKLDGPSEERQVGEVAVSQTVDQTPPQMLWVERANSKQTTLLEKK